MSDAPRDAVPTQDAIPGASVARTVEAARLVEAMQTPARTPTRPASRPVDFGRGFPAARPAQATLLTRLLAATVVLVACGASCWEAGYGAPLAFAAIGLAGGMALEPYARDQRWQRSIAGLGPAVVAASLVGGLEFVLIGLPDGHAFDAHVDSRWMILLPVMVGAFILGLDWLDASRLRLVVALSAAAMLPILVTPKPAAMALTALWLGAALTVFRRCERDADRGAPHLPSRAVIRPTGTEPAGRRWLALMLLLGCLGAVAVMVMNRPVEIPKISAPTLTLPERPGPSIDRPNVDMPQTDWPSGFWPRFEIPRFSMPKVHLFSLDISVPRVDLALAIEIALAACTLFVLSIVVTTAVLRVLERRAALLSRPWPVQLLERLTREGRRRGCPKLRAETIDAYTTQLADSVLPEPRLRDVGNVLSCAFFSDEAVPDDAGTWAATVLDDAIAAFPRRALRKERRAERRAATRARLRARWRAVRDRRRARPPTPTTLDPITADG